MLTMVTSSYFSYFSFNFWYGFFGRLPGVGV